MPNKPNVTQSAASVFQDLGIADPSVMRIKSRIAMEIQRVLEDRGMTQVEAADLMGIDQPKLSAILRGKFRGFTIDRMVRYLEALDVEVFLSFEDKKVS